MKIRRVKSVVQTCVYLPYFLSWVIFAGLVQVFLEYPSAADLGGVVNQVIASLGGTPIDFLKTPSMFRGILTISNIIKTAGYSAIVYFAAIAGINPTLYESAAIDGANRKDMMLHITPVSYTHLDVYKRQFSYRQKGGPLPFRERAVFPFAPEPERGEERMSQLHHALLCVGLESRRQHAVAQKRFIRREAAERAGKPAQFADCLLYTSRRSLRRPRPFCSLRAALANGCRAASSAATLT